MKEWSYTTGLLVGAVLLLIAGLALTWSQILEYNKGAPPAAIPTSRIGGPQAPQAGEAPPEGAAGAVDTSEPESVARAFLAAVAAGDLEGATQHVLGSERASFREAMEAGLPAVSAEAELAIEQEDDSATVEITGTDLTLQLTYRDERWWVAW